MYNPALFKISASSGNVLRAVVNAAICFTVSLTYSAWGGILTENDVVYFVFLICLFVFPSCVFKLCVCTPAAIDAK